MITKIVKVTIVSPTEAVIVFKDNYQQGDIISCSQIDGQQFHVLLVNTITKTHIVELIQEDKRNIIEDKYLTAGIEFHTVSEAIGEFYKSTNK